ncbi:hypothetical protein [Phosphitispora sp. TUW77]|uniref:hypothetical protein n=1 Tax=Phosphitispora sp. TUW77 TaxID=3152361 RepID=UPI003AB65120
MRRYLCLSLIILLLLPSWSWAAQDSREVTLIDMQVLNDVKGFELIGKQVIITNNAKSVKFTGIYRFQNTGEDTSVLLGLPESLKKLSAGFDSELKPENVRLVVGTSLEKPKIAENSKTIAGKELKGSWMTWEISLKAKSVTEIRLIYSIYDMPFGSDVQISYIPAAEPNPAANMKSFRTVMELGPFTPAEVIKLQPEDYELNPTSVVWDTVLNTGDSENSSENSAEKQKYIMVLDNSLLTAYPQYFDGQDKQTIDEAVGLMKARNYKEAAAKLELLSVKQSLDAKQRDYLSFLAAAVDLGQKDYAAVISDLKDVNPDKLQLSGDQTVFKGLYFYYLTQAYKDTGEFDKLQDLTDRGQDADVSEVMREWLGVTSKRMRNVENIMEGKSPDESVYDSNTIDAKIVWMVIVIVVLAGGSAVLWNKRKKK